MSLLGGGVYGRRGCTWQEGGRVKNSHGDRMQILQRPSVTLLFVNVPGPVSH